jgi:O-antigen/teichoic acid export membrane protein
MDIAQACILKQKHLLKNIVLEKKRKNVLKRLQHISPKMLVLGDQAIVSGASFLTNIMVARSLGVNNYGKFSVVILVQLFLLSVQQSVSSGIYQVMFGTMEGDSKRNYTNGVFYLQCLLYLLFATAGILVYYLFPTFTKGYEMIFMPALIGTLLFLFQDLLRKILLTRQNEWKALLIDLITNFIQIVLLSVFAFTGKLSLSLACWIIALTFIPSIMAGVYWVKPGLVSLINMKWAAHIHKVQSSWMLMSALLQWFAGNFFVVAAGMWLGIAALGALRLAQYIFGLLNVLIQAIENYALPHASSLQKTPILFNGFLKNVLHKVILIIVPILLLLSIFSKQLLRIAGGDSYLEYSYVIYGLSLVYILIIIGLPIRIALRVRLLNQHYFVGYLLASGFSMLTAHWLIKDWHLMGVLTGLLLTQLIIVVYWSTILTRKKY